MIKKQLVRVVSTALCGVMMTTACSTLIGCVKTQGAKKSSVVLMTEELSGLFNPFYATSGADMDVVGMTQIGMLSTDKDGLPVAGDDLPTVVKDFEVKTTGTTEKDTKTVYTFVLKNGLKFADGEPLTMEDVLFNMYEYLDPVYTGSSTMYSIDIDGLAQYRTQTNYSSGGDEASAQISNQATGYATARVLELVRLFENKAKVPGSTNSYSISEEDMREAINTANVTPGYKLATSTTKEQTENATNPDFYRKKLMADYDLTLKTFKEELESDYKAAKESFDLTTAPYAEWANKLSNDLFKFFLYEGYITPKYLEVQGRKDKTKIVGFDGEAILDAVKTQEQAINKVYGDNVTTALNSILTRWGTAGTLKTLYTGEAIDVILHNKMTGDGLEFPNIKGIVSLGHTTDTNKVTVNGKEYTVAQEHNADGTPADKSTNDVLQITVNGTDPKAIYSFGFTVAPSHYYGSANGTGNDVTIDIENNDFGVEYASSEFQSKVIQSQRNVEVPMGAGAFMATDEDNKTNPTGSNFWNSNIVYFKKNDNFQFPVKAAKLRMQVVSASNALDKLANGEVDYVTPQFTKANAERLEKMSSNGFESLSAWQLGYGYIGINAGKVPNIHIRRAIMAAMETKLALEFYSTGTCEAIAWPMSKVSWAYPFFDVETRKNPKPNGVSYAQWTGEADAKKKIEDEMKLAGVVSGDASLKIKFTVAGASITEHPTYAVFKQAAKILNDMGWEVEVKADSQALTKLSTGSLEVWAAAWGSTVDPDMYQVYHKNSTATSVYAWGYREIKASPATYVEENKIIGDLSTLIDNGRSYMEQKDRRPIYEQAMQKVLELAVELPVYQRQTLYAYNSKTITGLNTDVNPYSSPLEKIWELELK